MVRYGLDAPTGPTPLSFVPGQRVTVSGWVFLEASGQPVGNLSLVLQDLRTLEATDVSVRRASRLDVAQHFGRATAVASGFTGELRVDPYAHGLFRVRLAFHAEDGHASAIDLFEFTIGPSSYEQQARSDLAGRFLSGSGLEIGALQRRLPVPPDCRVTYVDRMPLSELFLHYPELRDHPLQAPDIVDDGEVLSKICSETQDFVIANHLLEHCTNPIQTLFNFGRVLKGGGVLFMAVPDKRLTFDAERPVTPFDTLAQAFREGRRANTDTLYREWASSVMKTQPAQVHDVAQRLSDERYSIHFNVWTLSGLLDFLRNCQTDFRLPFELEWMVSSENEVIVILRKQESPPSRSLAVSTSAPRPVL